MDNQFWEEVREYRANIYIGAGNKQAFLFLKSDNYNMYFTFYKEGMALPADNQKEINGRQHFYLNLHYGDYPNMLDLLRNEKPVHFFYRIDAQFGYLTTSSEPVGEGEE